MFFAGRISFHRRGRRTVSRRATWDTMVYHTASDVGVFAVTARMEAGMEAAGMEAGMEAGVLPQQARMSDGPAGRKEDAIHCGASKIFFERGIFGSCHDICDVPIIRAAPELADRALSNSDNLQGAIAIVKRGACSFVEKALRVTEAGAVGMIVVNSEDTMIAPGDSAQEGGGVLIPVVGIRSSDLATLIACEREPVSLVFDNSPRVPRPIVREQIDHCDCCCRAGMLCQEKWNALPLWQRCSLAFISVVAVVVMVVLAITTYSDSDSQVGVATGLAVMIIVFCVVLVLIGFQYMCAVGMWLMGGKRGSPNDYLPHDDTRALPF